MKHDLLKVNFELVNAILIQAPKTLLDVSYSIMGTEITIQIVRLNNGIISPEFIDMISNSLSEYTIQIVEIQISKDLYNENKGNWLPAQYSWLPYVLFSKAEVI